VDRIKEIFKKAVVMDAHSDILNDIIARRKKGQSNLMVNRHIPLLEKGGVNALIFAVYVEARYKPEKELKRAIQLIDTFFVEMKESHGEFVLCLKADDFIKAKKEGKIGILLGLEGGEPLGTDFSVLRLFYKIGVRYIGLTWNQRNQIADGASETRTNSGLTNYGIKLVKELNKLGILIDLSHISESSFRDVLKITKSPVIVSHTCCYSLCPHERNLKDYQIKAIAKNEGVIGVTTYPALIDKDSPCLDKLLDHIDHIVKLVGINHVGFGADFSDVIDWGIEEVGPSFDTQPKTKGLEGVTELPNLIKGLVERGYSDKEIVAILGGNFLRVFKEVIL